MIVSTIAVGEGFTYFISKHYNYIENDKIEEGTSLNNTNKNLDPFAYRLKKCVEDVFQTMFCFQIHAYHTNEEHEEEDIWRTQRQLELWIDEQRDLQAPEYFNGSNEVV